MPITEAELLSFETPIELGFVSMLATNGFTNAFESRSVLSAESPWVEVLLNTGPSIHNRARPGFDAQSKGAFIPDAWESILTFIIKSNREDQPVSPTYRKHKTIIGAIRAMCLVYNIRNLWRVQNTDGSFVIPGAAYYSIMDTHETGCQASTDDDNCLDISEISFTVKHNIRPDVVWPTN